MNTTKFGILGYGYVGKATHESLIKNYDCVIHDKNFNSNIDIFHDTDVIFICIPTDRYEDFDIIIDEILKIKNINRKTKFVIRSTLPIGQSNRIQDAIQDKIIYIPEFLRERFWNIDCHRRPLIVGFDGRELPQWLQEQDIIQCSTSEAELVKMFSNNFAVMRIAFANVFYDLAEKTGADYDLVKNMFQHVQQNQTYLEVPGHDGTRGFGGKCLPKDLDFLIDTLDNLQIDQNWFKHIRQLNYGWKEKFQK
jgi:UDPglucose 6-dehydrogenase